MRFQRFFVGAILTILVPPAAAQVASTRETEELINYAYATGDTAFFKVVGHSAQVVRLPLSYTIRSTDEHPWGVKLRFPVSLGLHEFTADGIGTGEIQESVATISGLVGVEFEVPLDSTWTLSPYAEFGAGKDLDGGTFAWIYSAGLYAVAAVPSDRVLYRIGSGLTYDGASLAGGGPSAGYTTLEVGLDTRFPIHRPLGGRCADWSVYGIRRRFLDALTFDQLEGQPEQIRNQNEIGFTLGVDRPWKLWLLKIDRVGLGVRFGERFNSVRVMFGVPF
jgi:hypothetical protein